MQAQCPQCAQRIVVDDAKAPDKPFSVKCPKCQALVRFPGRAAAAPAEEEPSAAASAPPMESSPEILAQLRKEIAGDSSKPKGQVLVALQDNALAGALTQPLTRLGYIADTLDNPEEGGRMLEQGYYDILITNRLATIPGRNETLYQRVTRLSPEARRRVFLILVGEDLKTGDGLQAFVSQADLLIHPKDAANIESVLLNSLSERSRLYQVFLDARRRYEESVG